MSITPPPAPPLPAFTGPESGGRAPGVAPREPHEEAASVEQLGPHPLDEAVGWLERLEARRRQLDAARLELIAAAVEQVTGQAPGQAQGRALDQAAEHADAPTCGAREIAYRALRAELAAAFNLSEHQTETQMDLAYRLTRHYPATFAALERGELASEHARVIVDAGLLIGAGDAPELRARRAGYEREVLEVAVRETPNRLRPIARRLAERWAETTLEERHREASARRRVVVIDGEDGMADLVAHLPAIEAHAIGDRLTRIARAAERGERLVRERDEYDERGERRTRDQLRADAFADLLLADERALFAGSTAEAIRAHVQVIVPAAALPGSEVMPGAEASEAPGGAGPCELVGELVGSGPIAAGTARGIAGAAEHWDRVDVRPDSGEVIGVDRYRPSERMRRLLGARDRTCRFPGCRVPVRRCDIDHTVDAALGGPTTTANLAHLCRGHHTLKHHGDWRVAQESGGTLRWTSPTGRVHVDRPPGALAGARAAEEAYAAGGCEVDDIVAASRSGALGTAVAAAIPIA